MRREGARANRRERHDGNGTMVNGTMVNRAMRHGPHGSEWPWKAPVAPSPAVWGGSNFRAQTKRVVLALTLPFVLSLTLLLTAGCGDPQARDPRGKIGQDPAPVPTGAHLYCIANVSHTLVAYSLTSRAVLPDTARYLDLDPVGPWFDGTWGYYLSRVASSGNGSNALVRFDPKTTRETGRLNFGANSNPNALLLFADLPGVAWVALRGATFDFFNINGAAVVDLTSMTITAYCDLNTTSADCAALAPGLGARQTSLLGFRWDAAGCIGAGGAGCAYAVVNNFDGTVRNGTLLVLGRDGDGKPYYLDAIPLGRNPRHPTLLDGDGELWVVNNGGYVHFGDEGAAGTLQVLDPALFATGTAGDGTLDTLEIESEATCAGLPSPDPGCDPTGLYSADGLKGWLTTYPHGVSRTVDLASNTIDASDWSLPRVTGPYFQAAGPPGGLFVARGGFGWARLAEVDPDNGNILSDSDLQAGYGPLTCGEFNTP